MKTIKWTNKSGWEFEIFVDDDDYERVNKHNWRVQVYLNKRGDKRCYVSNGEIGRLHRFILNVADSKIQVDHINHNGLDNRKCNLRLCDNKENNLNRYKFAGTSSKFKGVSWYKGSQKWQCIACVNGKGKHLGYFTSELEAALAYDNYVKSLPDVQFRILNFPDKIS